VNTTRRRGGGPLKKERIGRGEGKDTSVGIQNQTHKINRRDGCPRVGGENNLAKGLVPDVDGYRRGVLRGKRTIVNSKRPLNRDGRRNSVDP